MKKDLIYNTSERVYRRNVRNDGVVVYDLVLCWIDSDEVDDTYIHLLSSGRFMSFILEEDIASTDFRVWSMMSKREKREFRTFYGQTTVKDVFLNFIDKIVLKWQKNRSKTE